jgi:hypothetical protein
MLPEAVGYGHAAGAFGPPAVHAGAGHAGNGYRAPTGYADGSAEPGWQITPETQSWQDLKGWQEWGPPPELHPDHPSAPVPRVQVPADHPSGPMPAPRTSGPPGAPQWRPDEPARAWSAPPPSPDAGYDNGNRLLYAVPDEAPYADHAGPGRFQNSAASSRDSLWTAGQVLTLAEGRAAQIAQQAHDYAAAIRESAEREAAAITQQASGHAATVRQAAERQAAEIRQAAEREAAELRARLDSMSGELGRVAAYVTESLAAPAMPSTAPALPGAPPAPPGASPAQPTATPARHDATPSRPDTTPAGPAKPRTTPAKKPQKQGRQQQAMRIATAATAALCLFAVGTGATEIGLHGFPFFVFRSGGTGQTAGTETDQQFLARQAAAAHHVVAPKGRHHRKPHQALKVHHN